MWGLPLTLLARKRIKFNHPNPPASFWPWHPLELHSWSLVTCCVITAHNTPAGKGSLNSCCYLVSGEAEGREWKIRKINLDEGDIFVLSCQIPENENTARSLALWVQSEKKQCHQTCLLFRQSPPSAHFIYMYSYRYRYRYICIPDDSEHL